MTDKKVIGIDARMIEMSGIGTYIQHLMGKGIYDYALGSEQEIKKYDKDVKIIPYDASIYSPKEQLMFPNKAVKMAGVDIMHFPHYNVPVSYKGCYVTTVHDLIHIILPEFLGSKVKYYYAKFLMGQALRRAEHVFTVSENSKKDIINYFGIDKDKISITYAAIDEKFREKENGEIDYLYEKYQIPRNIKKILYVGNLKPHKNLITLLRAFKELDAEDVVLLLVGKAFKNFDLKEQEIKLGIKERVIHTGIVAKEELVDLYNLADLFVFPSLYEGFGLPPLEAMACGTPVIAADNSSIPEVCGDAAIFVDGRNYMELSMIISNALNDELQRNCLVKKGRERSTQFDWGQAESEVKKVLSRLTKDL